MKNLILTILVIIFTATTAISAELLHVESLTNFSTYEYPRTVKLRALNNITLSPELTIKEGYILTGKLVDVRSPKRLKRDAKFSFRPTSYMDNNGITRNIKESFIGKYSEKLEIDKGEIAKKAALGVGSYFVQGLSMGYYAVEGAVKNESENRLKSSAKSVYENSPLSYVEKGEDIEIGIHDIFALKFKVDNIDEDLTSPGVHGGQNYTYTIE